MRDEMASSEEAFAKFGVWNESRTVLKLTALTKDGKPEILRGRISSLDEERHLIGFAVTAARSFKVIDVGDASFRVGKSVVEAERGRRLSGV